MYNNNSDFISLYCNVRRIIIQRDKMNEAQLELLLDLRTAVTIDFFWILALSIAVIYLLIKQIRKHN